MKNTAIGIVLPISIFTAYIVRSTSIVLNGDKGPDERCEDEWFSAGHGCYKVIATPSNFEEAKILCNKASHNATMAELETRGEKMNLVTHMRPTYEIIYTGQLFWVGAQGGNASFFWNSGQAVNYTDYWDGTEEDYGCLAFGTTTAEKFQPVNCTEKHIVICESSPLGVDPVQVVG